MHTTNIYMIEWVTCQHNGSIYFLKNKHAEDITMYFFEDFSNNSEAYTSWLHKYIRRTCFPVTELECEL